MCTYSTLDLPTLEQTVDYSSDSQPISKIYRLLSQPAQTSSSTAGYDAGGGRRVPGAWRNKWCGVNHVIHRVVSITLTYF